MEWTLTFLRSVTARPRGWVRLSIIATIGAAVLAILSISQVSVPTETRATAFRPSTIIVTRTKLVSTLDAVGQIQPGVKIVVVAPFEGYVSDRLVTVGDRMHKDDPVIVMDTSELETQAREAESALLKAAMNFDALSRWETGPDVAKARRALVAAQVALAAAEQHGQDTKVLFDRGIVSRNDYENSVQQVDAQRNQVASSDQELASTIARGDTDNRRMAELEHANARERMEVLKTEMSRKIVLSPADGLVMRAPVSTSAGKSEPENIEAGMHVSKGQALLTIANLDTLFVEALVDEVDVNKITVGQPVDVESDSFAGAPIRGRISRVGIEADQSSQGGISKFTVLAAFSVGEARGRLIRVGMSARMTIVTYTNPDALVIPQDAVTTRNGVSLSERSILFRRRNEPSRWSLELRDRKESK